MLEIYDGEIRSPVRQIRSVPSVENTREINGFTRLPNPTFHMFVFPHLATVERVPIPGYWTQFQLYERDEYAQGGEVTIDPEGEAH